MTVSNTGHVGGLPTNPPQQTSASERSTAFAHYRRVDVNKQKQYHRFYVQEDEKERWQSLREAQGFGGKETYIPLVVLEGLDQKLLKVKTGFLKSKIDHFCAAVLGHLTKSRLRRASAETINQKMADIRDHIEKIEDETERTLAKNMLQNFWYNTKEDLRNINYGGVNRSQIKTSIKESQEKLDRIISLIKDPNYLKINAELEAFENIKNIIDNHQKIETELSLYYPNIKIEKGIFKYLDISNKISEEKIFLNNLENGKCELTNTEKTLLKQNLSTLIQAKDALLEMGLDEAIKKCESTTNNIVELKVKEWKTFCYETKEKLIKWEEVVKKSGKK